MAETSIGTRLLAALSRLETKTLYRISDYVLYPVVHRLYRRKIVRKNLSLAMPLLGSTFGISKVQLGIYGACVKIAMIMAMITQAFRYAYEPFVFAGSKDKDQKVMYSEAMKYFILFTLLAFLMVMGYMDLLKIFLIQDEGYWEGLKVVPIVMIAEIMMGISFNLSIWYKLTDKTIWGAVISIIGCVVLLAVNIVFVPQYSYMACAWGAVVGYGICMVLSYFLGQKYFPINYQLKTIFLYVLLAVAGYFAITYFNENLPLLLHLALNTLVIAAFAAACVLQIKRK